MDKYQKDLLQKTEIFIKNKTTNQTINIIRKQYSENDDNLNVEVVQNEDITQTKYEFHLVNHTPKTIENIEVVLKDGSKEIVKEVLIENWNRYLIVFDFDNQNIEKLVLNFKFDLADPLEIPVTYVEADKEEYYRKENERKEKELREFLLSKMNISHSCGQDLITIKFQNCDEKVVTTKISLYDENQQLMGVFKVDEGMLFKSITNLAYGKYFYDVAQYDKDDNLIIKSNLIKFSLKMPNYGGKPIICG